MNFSQSKNEPALEASQRLARPGPDEDGVPRTVECDCRRRQTAPKALLAHIVGCRRSIATALQPLGQRRRNRIEAHCVTRRRNAEDILRAGRTAVRATAHGRLLRIMRLGAGNRKARLSPGPRVAQFLARRGALDAPEQRALMPANLPPHAVALWYQVCVKPMKRCRKPASRGLPRKVEKPLTWPVVPQTLTLSSRGIHLKCSQSPSPPAWKVDMVLEFLQRHPPGIVLVENFGAVVEGAPEGIEVALVEPARPGVERGLQALPPSRPASSFCSSGRVASFARSPHHIPAGNAIAQATTHP